MVWMSDGVGRDGGEKDGKKTLVGGGKCLVPVEDWYRVEEPNDTVYPFQYAK